jgi:hypothetical protein
VTWKSAAFMQKAPAPFREHPLPSEDVLRRIRIPLIRRASLSHDGLREDVFVVDLAFSGVFVERVQPLDAGTRVELVFTLPGNEIPITAECRVAWWHAPDAPPRSLPAGAGLEFVSLPALEQERIRQCLSEYYQRTPRTRRFVSHEGEP